MSGCWTEKGWKHFFWRPAWLEVDWTCSFLSLSSHLPYNWGKTWKLYSGFPSSFRLHSFRWLIRLLSIWTTRLTVRGFRQPLVCTISFQITTSANFESKFSVNALMCLVKNGVIKSSWILLADNARRCVNHKCRYPWIARLAACERGCG